MTLRLNLNATGQCNHTVNSTMQQQAESGAVMFQWKMTNVPFPVRGRLLRVRT